MLSRKILLIVTAIPIWFAPALVAKVAEEFDHRDPSTWTMLTHDNNTGNCMGEDFIKCYENILEYVTLGEKAIKISEEKKAVIVIGLTRVGKSTLTQFIANETNPLIVSCVGIICQLIDDSGDGGDSVVSKTFVPNTVEHIMPDGNILTPFYDMPGFDDTRNISVEIANSFFIQKVINNIEEIKIVVVAKHASFSSTETTFKTLITFLIKFAKDPTKFRNSIVIISNFGSYVDDDAPHFINMRNYMMSYNESMYGAESSHPDPQERATATAWINCFLNAPEDNPENLQRAAVFRSPGSRLNGTSIRNDPYYQKDSERMKQLIWNETVFTPIGSDDVGFTLSTEAELFLERATRESDTSIRNTLNGFAVRMKAHLQDFIKRMKGTPNKEGMTRLHTHITTLHNLYFPDCKNNIESSPRECINQIEHQLATLATEMGDLIFTNINKTTNYLQFAFENIGKEKEYNMEDWVTGVFSVWYDTDLYFNNTGLEISTTVIKDIENLANVAYDSILLEFEKLVSSNNQGPVEKLNETVSELLFLENFYGCSDDGLSSPISCFEEIIEKTNLIRELSNSDLVTELQDSVTFLELACSELELCLGLRNWVVAISSLKAKVVGGLEEKTVPQNMSIILLAQITEVAAKLRSEILHDVPNFVSISDLQKRLLFAKNAAEEINRLLENYNTAGSLSGYTDLALSAYRDLLNASVAEVFLDGIYVLERLQIFPWYSPAWINFHRDSITLPVVLEWQVSDFQSTLYKNLGASSVQVDEYNKTYQWRLENPTVHAGNFDKFWEFFASLGIEAMRAFSAYREDIKLHISDSEYSRNWLNILLDYTIGRHQASCPTAQSGVVRFEKKYLTLQFIYECLKNSTVKPNTIVALAEHTFFFDVDFENLGISTKYKLFVMSLNFDYTRGQRINLMGKDGEPPSQNPPPTPTNPGENGKPGSKGNDGKAGADFVGVYLADIGNPDRVNIMCNGGKGGNGQVGGNGADSANTRGPSISLNPEGDLPYDKCSAWESGSKVQVKIFPNSCNYNYEGTCNVGTWVKICGDEPGRPGSKGVGGSPGLGGSGGFKVIVNVTSSTPSVTNFLAGANGYKGNDGLDGKKGYRGATEIKIGDRYCWSCFERVCNAQSGVDTSQVCHVLDKTQNSSSSPDMTASEFRSRLQTNRKELQKHSNPPSTRALEYSLDDFKPYIRSLLENSLKGLNIFNRQDVTTFVAFVQSNPLLV